MSRDLLNVLNVVNTLIHANINSPEQSLADGSETRSVLRYR